MRYGTVPERWRNRSMDLRSNQIESLRCVNPITNRFYGELEVYVILLNFDWKTNLKEYY
jgi:hypothetical protein